MASGLMRRVERLSLPDWAFFPLAAAVVAGMIVYAVSQREDRVGALLTATSFEAFGPELARFVEGQGVSAQYEVDGEYAVISSDGGLAVYGNRSAGAGFALPSGLEEAVIGQRIRVTAEVRTDDETLSHFHLGYFTTEGHDSRWRQLEVGPEWAEVGFSHDIPAEAEINNQEWLGIWPDEAGLGRSLQVRRIGVEILRPVQSEE